MRIQLASAKLMRHSLRCTEIHHIECATGTDIRGLPACHCAEPVVRARENTAEEVVTDLGGGDVQHATDKAVVQTFLHGLATRARAVKYEAVKARTEQPDHLLNARGRHSEHGEPQGGPLVVYLWQGVQHHARQSMRGISEYTT